ncbi:glycosyltransferase family 4 protein [Cellulosimicrobium protaetiae]|uniref:Glycosyltransferase family 4 protein n=1 Tax=Cellulosimicrobium protaetiae TaxID=2587808 RepID=A0A6M5UCL1_9MICO|nr:glycosyltransferase family 4 protein [Cellulosimicrobium protaetiae]QJW35970.1 glycosyltransferase family 4 protein [Cellulosimicrobium protaetiae]
MTAPGGPPLRVLVLDHTAELGGAELALVRTCAALGPAVDVRVLLFADGPLRARLAEVGVRVDVVPLASSVATTDRASAGRLSAATVAGALRTLPFLWRLSRRVRALRPDVVHTTSLKADLLGIVPAAVARRPLVWHVHDRIAPDYLPGPLVRVVRALARRAPAAVVANSRATAGTLPAVTAVAYPGFAREQAAGADAPAAARADVPGPTVVMVGRISPTKGQLEVVRALRAVVDAVPAARLRIVGEPAFGAEDYAALVRAEVTRLGLDDHVDLVGFVADPRAELDAAAVCVHASPVPEPFGQVVVEAMVRGVPVVATRAGGVEEILVDAEDAEDAEAADEGDAPLGLLVPPGDSDALATAVLDVLRDPAAACERAQRARASALRRFPVERTARVLTDVWTSVSGGARRA